MKGNQQQLSPTNSDTKFSSQVNRTNFRRFKQTIKSHKPVKKINVNLDIVHVIYNLDDFKSKEVEKEVNLDVSESSNTEFNVFSSVSESIILHKSDRHTIELISK
jgi:hypothetical protein